MKKKWIVAGLVIVAVVAGVMLIGRNAAESGSAEDGDVVKSPIQSTGAASPSSS